MTISLYCFTFQFVFDFISFCHLSQPYTVDGSDTCTVTFRVDKAHTHTALLHCKPPVSGMMISSSVKINTKFRDGDGDDGRLRAALWHRRSGSLTSGSCKCRRGGPYGVGIGKFSSALATGPAESYLAATIAVPVEGP